MNHPTVGVVAAGADEQSNGAWGKARASLSGAVGSIGITLVAVLIVGGLWVGGSFFSRSNLSIIGSNVTVPLLVGTLSGFALLAGVVDLSIGSNAGFCAAVFAYLGLHGWGGWQAAGVVVVLSLVVGAVNAIAVVGFGANSIAATLGMLTVLRGLSYVICGTGGGLEKLIPGLYSFTNRQLGPFPDIFLLTILVVVLATVLAMRGRVGWHIRAVGGDERAALRAGISVVRARWGVFLLSGLGAGLGGILYEGQLGGATNLLGTGLEFQVYAALMIGGYSILRGGVGNPAGGAMGLLVVAGVTDIIDVKAINTYYTDVIVGVLLVLVVLLDRLRGGDAYE
jgi:ribose transport system permease protein